MESRAEAELYEIKRSLEKSLAEAGHEEQIFDQLGALERAHVTPKTIKETRLGNTLAAVRGKFKTTDAKIAEKAAAIMANWKKIMEANMNKTAEDHGDGHKEVKKDVNHKPAAVSFVSVSSSSGSGGTHMDLASVEAKVNALPAARKTVYNILLTTLTESTPRNVAGSVALHIEEALNNSLSADSALKAYTNKAKSLAFNLKKNDALRQHVVCGTITCTDLVTLSAADLASHEQKLAREKLQAEEVEARRSDWLEAHKQELQADIGIDPANTWDFDNGADDNNSEPDVEGD